MLNLSLRELKDLRSNLIEEEIDFKLLMKIDKELDRLENKYRDDLLCRLGSLIGDMVVEYGLYVGDIELDIKEVIKC